MATELATEQLVSKQLHLISAKSVADLARLIADSLEGLFLVEMCDEVYEDGLGGSRCALDPSHVGRHVTRDGRHHWLED